MHIINKNKGFVNLQIFLLILLCLLYPIKSHYCGFNEHADLQPDVFEINLSGEKYEENTIKNFIKQKGKN